MAQAPVFWSFAATSIVGNPSRSLGAEGALETAEPSPTKEIATAMNRSVCSTTIRTIPWGKLSLALALFLLLSPGLRAQNAPLPSAQNVPTNDAPMMGAPMHPHHMNPHKQLERLTKMLNLSPDQQKQILPILRERDWQMQKMMHKQKEFKWKMEAVLTDAQKQQFDAMLAARRKRMREHWQQMQQQEGASPANGAQPSSPASNGSQPPAQ